MKTMEQLMAETNATMNNHDRIDAIWAFISEDETGEGVCAVMLPDRTVMPLIAADERRLALIRPEAEALAKRTDKTIKLIRLTHRQDLEIIR